MSEPSAFLFPKLPPPVIAATRSKLARPTRPQFRPPMTRRVTAMRSSCFMAVTPNDLEGSPEAGGDRPDPGIVGGELGLFAEGDVALRRNNERQRAIEVVRDLCAGVDGEVGQVVGTGGIEGHGARPQIYQRLPAALLGAGE